MDRALRFTGRRVLVTGATGFIGSHLCRRLQEGGAELHAVSRKTLKTQTRSLQWHVGDMADTATVRSLFEQVKPDVVYHLAGRADGRHDLQLVQPSFRDDLMTTVNVLTLATELGSQRVVLTGSMDESRDGPPASPYAAAKMATNMYSQMFHAKYGTPVVVVRPYMTYGPGQRVEKLVPYVILSLLQDKSPRLSSGRRLVDWIYVDDVVEGFLAAGSTEGVEGNSIDLGTGNVVSIADLVDQLVHLTGTCARPALGDLPDRAGETNRVADAERASELIGWTASTQLTVGLERTVAWYRSYLASTCSDVLV